MKNIELDSIVLLNILDEKMENKKNWLIMF